MELRGFDHYEVKLGDEMRGVRASMAKGLPDVERDLRIKADLIVAIEDCDAEPFPNKGLIPGYVRSYARYLSMDADDCYQRFCVESGFRSPMAMAGLGSAAQIGGAPQPISTASIPGGDLMQSRFAAPAAPGKIGGPVSFGGVASSLALIGVVVGLSYGGYALLQDIQRIGFEPLPEAPVVVADTPLIRAPSIEPALIARSRVDDAVAGPELITAISEGTAPMPALFGRDGPISAINPAVSGVFLYQERRDRGPADAIAMAAAAPDFPAPLQRRIEEARLREAAAQWQMPEVVPVDRETALNGGAEATPKVSVHAVEEAWIRVRDERNATLFEGILAAGDRFDIPRRARGVSLRAGNAGGVFVLVDGVPFGPVGAPGRVAKGVSLAYDDIHESVPQAELAVLRAAGAGPALLSAAAAVSE